MSEDMDQSSSDYESAIPADDVFTSQEGKNFLHDLFFGKDYPKFNKQLWCAVPILFGELAFGIMVYGIMKNFIFDDVKKILKGENGRIHKLTSITFVVGIVTSCMAMSSKGRQKALLGVNVFILFGWYLLVFPSNMWMNTFIYLMVSISSAFTRLTNLVYITEIMEPHLRSFFLALSILVQAVGSFIAESMDTKQSYFWPVVVSVYMIWPTLSLISSTAIPESPLWCLTNNREQEAKKRFNWLNGISTESENQFQYLTNYTESVIENNKRGTMRIIFARTFLKPLFILLLLHTLRICNAYPMVMRYAAAKTYNRVFNVTRDIYQSKTAAAVTVKWGHMVETMTSFALVFLIVRCKRKVLLIVSTICTTFFVFLLITSTYYNFDKAYNFAIYLCYVLVINLGINTIPYFLTAEYFSQSIREYGSALVLTYNFYMDDFLMLYPDDEEFSNTHQILHDHTYYWSMWFGNIVLGIILFFIMPDTDELTLQEIEKQMNEGPWIQVTPRKLFPEVQDIADKHEEDDDENED